MASIKYFTLDFSELKQKLYYFISFFSFVGYYSGLGLIIFLGYIEFTSFYSIPLRILLAVLMIYLMVKIRFKHAVLNQPIYLLFFIFWGLYFIAIFKSMHGSTEGFYRTPMEVIIYSILYSIIPFLFFSLRHDESTLNIFKNALIASGLSLAILMLLLYKDLLLMGVGRINMAKYFLGDDFRSISPLALSYASTLIISVCLYSIIFLKLSRKIKIYYWVTIALSMVPFLLGSSRGSILSIIFTFSLIVFFRGSFKTKIRSMVLFLLLGAGVVYFADFFNSSLISRFLSISEDIESGSSSAARLVIWKHVWLQFLSSPIFGDSIQSSYRVYPHNIFLEVLMATGILGFIPFVILVSFAFIKGIKIVKYHPKHVWIFIMFSLAFVQHLLSYTFYSAIYFWSGMGLIYSFSLSKKETLIQVQNE